MALGDTVQHVGINGQATLYVPGQSPVNAGSGMLAAASNIGSYLHNAFAVVPEVGLNLGYDLTSWLRVKVGYSFIYWSSVVRPGGQIDRNLDPRQSPSLQAYIPGFVGHEPVPFFNTSSFWAQGLNVGVQLRF